MSSKYEGCEPIMHKKDCHCEICIIVSACDREWIERIGQYKLEQNVARRLWKGDIVIRRDLWREILHEKGIVDK